MRVYIAGPYTAKTKEERDQNVRLAEEVGKRVASAGYIPFIPHKMTHGWDEDPRFGEGEEARKFFMNICLAWLGLCDAILVLPGYENSRGTLEEINYAKAHGIKILYSLELLGA